MTGFARRLQRVLRQSLPGSTSPTADAGSVAVGAAAYTVPGDAIYVATTGNDTSGTGASGAPYRTLGRAITAATAGKTIVLRAGVYHEGGSNHTSAIGVQVTKNNLTIQNYPGEAVWFDGSSTQTGWTQSGSTWYIPWTKVFDHSPTATSGANDGTDPGWKWINDNYPCAPFPEQVFVDGVALTQVGSLGEVTTGTFFVDGTTASNKIFTPTRLYIGTNPSGKTVNVTDLHVFLNLGVGYSGLTLRGVGVRRYGNALPQYSILRIDGNNNTTNSLIENVVIQDIATMALTSNQCHGNTIRHVTVSRAGYRAMGGYRSDNLTFDKVLIEYTNTENFNSSPDSGCIKVTQSQHVTLSNSILRDSKCKGMWFDMSVYDMNVYNNDFLRLKDTCAFFEISGTGICVNNLFVDCPSEAVKVNNTDNMQVWNNTIVNCGALSERLTPDTSNLGNGDRRPLAVYQEARRPANTSYGLDGRYPLGHAMYSTYMTWQINDIDIHNNIVADTPANAYAIFCIDDQQIQSGGTNQLLASYGANMTANVFHWTTAPTTTFPYPYIFPPTSVGSSTPVVYSTHTAMRSATSLNANGIEINAKSSGTSNPSPIDSNYEVTTAQAALHTNATALSGTIATLIGQTAGTKHAGVWRGQTETPPVEETPLGLLYGRTMTLNQHTLADMPANTAAGTSRFTYKTQANVTKIRLTFMNWYNSSYKASPYCTDNNNAASVTVQALVFGPGSSTGTVVTVSGNVSWTVNGGAWVQTDWIPVTMTAGQSFDVQTYVSGTQWYPTLVYSGWWASGSNQATAGSAKITSGASASTGIYMPAVVTGDHSNAAPLILGDSIAYNSALGTLGYIEKGLDGSYGAINAAVAGDRAYWALDGTGRRVKSWLFNGDSTTTIVEYGRNDLGDGRTVAQLQANLLTIWNQQASGGRRVIQTTITPHTNSTDSWATVGNQTPVNATVESRRVQFNDWLRAGAPIVSGAAVAPGTSGALLAGQAGHPLYAYWEIADQVETARNSGIWRAPSYTTDGLHPTTTGINAAATGVQTGSIV